ncbi:MAG TPA: Sec-independent protein translocase protein TatB [Paracoccaceae bacterium]|nr:Sec-independent protein translocase protein TatB [Paracoccaceae bacterium]
MFDLAWSEILVIAAVAVIFIGPKELPAALRTFGKWTAKARQMAGEFQRNVDDMVREAELEDVKKQFDEVRGLATNPTGAIEKWVDPKGEIRGAFDAPDAGASYDKPGLDKPVLDKLGATQPAAAELAPQAAPALSVPAAEPAAMALASAESGPAAPVAVAPAPAAPAPETGTQSAAPPSVMPPPPGAGTPAEPKATVTAP